MLPESHRIHSHKLAHRSSPCLFLGYPTTHRGYRCLELSSGKIILSRHVTFDEFSFPLATPSPSISPSSPSINDDPDTLPLSITHCCTQTTNNTHPNPPAPTATLPSDLPEPTSTPIAATPPAAPPVAAAPPSVPPAHHPVSLSLFTPLPLTSLPFPTHIARPYRTQTGATLCFWNLMR